MLWFGAQKAKVHRDVGLFMRRLLDTSVPGIQIPRVGGEARSASRCTRVLPVLLAPCQSGSPLSNLAVFGTTKDLSDHGLAVVLSTPLRESEVLIGMFSEQEFRFLRGEIKQCASIGAGFWQVGILALEVLDPKSSPKLQTLLPLAGQLVPH